MITAIIQARMASTRLPGKILKNLGPKSLLEHIIERLTYSKYISKIVVATTINPKDDEVVDWLEAKQVLYFRGSESDVLNRYYESARFHGARHIARITSDDPFKDPTIIDAVAELYFNDKLDFAYNNKPPSFAEGLDTEIFSFDAISQANSNAVDPFEREHVTQHFYRNPDRFTQKNLLSQKDFSHLRWTIDTQEDFNMADEVYRNLYTPGKIFYADDILKLLQEKPEIAFINSEVKRSTMYKK